MSRRFGPLFACAALTTLVGCSGELVVGGAGVDGAVDGGVDAGLLVAAPNIPWIAEGVPPIMLTPCPEGWREVRGDVVTECDPYPESGPALCDEGDAHFPGEPGCRPIGEPCPSGPYAASLPTTGPLLHVNAGAPSGGDGTLGAPFGALSEVPWVSLIASTTVALAKGTYEGTLPLKAGVSVVGACAEETVVTGVAAPVASVIVVTSAGAPAQVRNVTIRDAPQRGVEVDRGRSLSLRGVLLDRVRGIGVIASGAGTEIDFIDVVVRDTVAAPSGLEVGTGIHLQHGVRSEATRLLVVGNRGLGLAMIGAETVALLTDSVVRDTRPRDADRAGGRGVDVEQGARLDVTRGLVSGNHDVGIFAASPGSAVTLTDVVVRDTEAELSNGSGGHGLSISEGAELTAHRLLVARSHETGLVIAGAEGALTDVVIRDTQAAGGSASTGRGLSVQLGARLEATRLVIFGNDELGAMAAGEGSFLSITDGALWHTTASASGSFGRGLSVQTGARFDASRLLIANHRDTGLLAADARTVANLFDVVVQDTTARLSDGQLGRGLQAQDGARIDGSRLAIDRTVEGGVFAHRGATVLLSDVSVRGVEVAECAATTCPTSAHGHAVGAFGASLSLTRFDIVGAAVCGVMVAPEQGSREAASLDLELGVVSGSAIGACVQLDGYDLSRLTEEVRYLDNELNLDSTSLPVPDLAETL